MATVHGILFIIVFITIFTSWVFQSGKNPITHLKYFLPHFFSQNKNKQSLEFYKMLSKLKPLKQRNSYQNYSDQDLQLAMAEVKSGVTVYKVAAKYKIPKSTLYDKVREDDDSLRQIGRPPLLTGNKCCLINFLYPSSTKKQIF
jgi:hypothetical protein